MTIAIIQSVEMPVMRKSPVGIFSVGLCVEPYEAMLPDGAAGPRDRLLDTCIPLGSVVLT